MIYKMLVYAKPLKLDGIGGLKRRFRDKCDPMGLGRTD